MSPMLQVLVAARHGSIIRRVADTPRNWAYAPDAATALAGLGLKAALGHGLYNVCPDRRATVGHFVDRVRSTYPAIDDGVVPRTEETTISFDADPGQRRARIAQRRISDELPGFHWTGMAAACDRYMTWVQENPDWV
jgi:UDP-glucose 4-epimerase